MFCHLMPTPNPRPKSRLSSLSGGSGRYVLFLVAALILANTTLANSPGQPAVPSDQPAAQAARIRWWRKARFGIFVHWGLYSILGRGEWAQWNEQIPVETYAKLADRFDPKHFDADAWAKTFRAAGAKYVVLTTRHHDGFALFADPGNPFTSVSTAAHRDFVAAYVAAMRKANLRVGLYYSPLDWRFPGYIAPGIYRASAEAMRAQYHRQLRELLTNYGHIDILWFDGGEADWLSFGGDWKGPQWVKRSYGQHYAGAFHWGTREMYKMIRRLQPDVVINGRSDMPEDFHSREGDGALGNFDASHPWELCTTIVDGAWGWTPAPVKSLRHLIRMLVQTAGRDGNFLLNVGPRADGEIDPAQAERLREIGRWLKTNGESIYGTRGGPYLPGAYGVTTYSGRKIYLHLLAGSEGVIKLPPLAARIERGSLLDGSKVVWSQTPQGVEVSVNRSQWNSIDTIVVLDLDRDASSLTPIAVR